MSKPDSEAQPTLLSRREILSQASLGTAFLLAFTAGGCERKLTPAQARASQEPLRILDTQAVGTLEWLGETLLPGSAQAGLAHYIDHQLAGDPADSMLMIKYLGIAAPYADFYLSGLAGARAAALRNFGKTLTELGPQQRTTFLTRMSAGALDGWEGPAAPLFYFVLRGDAVDVMYGTPSGFGMLGVPYMPHIMPPAPWG